MHRVDTKRKKKAMLRVVAYSITLILTIITTVVLLYVALGYRLDRGSGHVVRSGLLLVDTKPEAAAIYIDGEQKDTQAPGRFVLSAGSYDVALKLNGYRDWNKKVTLSASGVREVNYPLLVPTVLKPETVSESEKPALASQSLDRKFILTHQVNQTSLTLVELDPKLPKQTVLSLASVLDRENGQVGTLKVIEWALNNRQVLLEQTLPSGAVQLFSLDVTKPSEVINITALYGEGTPKDIHYIGGKTDIIYGVKNDILSRYSLTEPKSEAVLRNVRSYQPYSDDMILFDRSNKQTSEVGIWQDGISTVIETVALTRNPTLLQYAKYDDNDYFVIARPDGTEVNIYKDPLKKPILAKQLPLAKVQFEKTATVKFSASSQFILLQNGPSFSSYDLEDLIHYKSNLPFGVESGTISWFDGYHLQVRSEAGQSFIMDFDGQNMQELVATAPHTKLYFAPNYRYMYSFGVSDQRTLLQSTSLVRTQD